jgi:Tol biopolymer transport system component
MWRARGRNPDIAKIKVTKITDSGAVGLVAISPDGRYLCYTLRERGGWGLWLYEVVARGTTRILAADAIAFQGITFSPDGSYIYYVRADKNDPGFKYLFTMPVLGGPSRMLVKDIDSPVSFSPDGRQFVYSRGMPIPNATEVRIANADGTANYMLATVPNTHPGFQPGPTWSPDGRTIAVSVLRYGRQSFALDAVSIANGDVHEMYSDTRAIGRPLWSPDGDNLLLVMEDQNGRGQLWTISYPEAHVRRVTNDLTNYHIRADLTHDAKSLAVVVDQTVANVWEAPVGRLGEAKQVTSTALPLLAVNESADGHLLVVGQDGRLWSIAADGTQRTVFTDLENVDNFTPCGRYVVLTASRATTTELLRVDSDGGNPTPLVSGDLASWSLACAPDGEYVFYEDLRPPHTIMQVPIDGGTPMKIAQVLGVFMVGRLSISRDAKFLAYPYEEYTPTPVLKLAVIPTKGDEKARISAAPGGAYAVGSLSWSPDSKSLQYILTENGASNIWEQTLDGSRRSQLTKFSTGRIFDFHWSHDRRRLLLSRGEVSSDVVLLGNLR